MSMRWRLGLAPVFLFVAVCAASAQPAAPPAAARAAARLEETWRSHGAPGMSEAVSLDGRIVFSQGRELFLADLILSGRVSP